jgi:hypothetical protein
LNALAKLHPEAAALVPMWSFDLKPLPNLLQGRAMKVGSFNPQQALLDSEHERRPVSRAI